jgi:Transposase C of IS166 homeodomain
VTDSHPDIPQSLPDDIEASRALVLATFVERDATVSERDTLLAQNDRLRHLLLKLTRMHIGARSERLPEEQLQLGLEALEQAIAKVPVHGGKWYPTRLTVLPAACGYSGWQGPGEKMSAGCCHPSPGCCLGPRERKATGSAPPRKNDLVAPLLPHDYRR